MQSTKSLSHWKSLDNQVVCGNNLDYLKLIPDRFAKAIFADPPFNLDKNYKNYNDDRHEDEYIAWSLEWIDECVRILQNNGSLFLHNIPKWLTQYCCILNEKKDMQFRHWIVWDSPTSPMGKSLQPAHYGIIYYVKGQFDPNSFHEIRAPHKRCRVCKTLITDYGGKKHTIPPHGPLVSDVWKDIHRVKHSKYRNSEHPCQLPIHLLERLILMSTEPGDMVLDPFLGTGTTAIAAKRLGRKYFGIEKESSYFDIIENRLENQKIESKLEEIYVSCFRKEIISVRDEDIYDHKGKRFKDTWKNLFKSWPNTDEDRVKLNTNSLTLKPEYSKIVFQLENQLSPLFNSLMSP